MSDDIEQAKDIGYLIARVEDLATDVKAQGVKLDALNERVDEKFKTAEATIRVLKVLGAIVIAGATLKWSDIPSLLGSLF